MLVSSILLAFLLTVLIEGAVALILGFRERYVLFTIFLANAITNPIVNYLSFLNSAFNWVSPSLLFLLPLEILIIVCEWKILASTFKKSPGKTSFLTLSIAMNACSFIVGSILFGLA